MEKYDVKVKLYGGSTRTLAHIIDELVEQGIDFEQIEENYVVVRKTIETKAPYTTPEEIREKKRRSKINRQKIWQM